VDRLNRQLTLLSVALLVIVAFLLLDWDRSEPSPSFDADAPPSHQLFDYEASTIVKVSLTQGDAKIELEQAEGAWQMVAPVATIAQASAVTAILDRFEDLRIEERALPGSPADYGLDGEKRIEVRLQQLDGTAFTVYVGEDAPVGYKSYAQVPGDESVHTLSSQVHGLVSKSADEFRGRDLLSFSPPSAERVRIVQGDREIVYRHDETGWWIGDTGPRASEKQISDYLAIVSGFKVERFLDGVKPADLGLDDPAASVTIKDAGGSQTLRIGQRDVDGAPAAVGDIPVRISATDLDVLLPTETWLATVLLEAKSWKVDAVTLQLGATKVELSRKAGSWKNAAGADAADGSAIVDALLALPVDRASTPKMVGEWGRVVVGLGSEKVTVKIGDPDGDGGRVARDEAGGPAFMIPAASLQVLADAAAGKLVPAEAESDVHAGGEGEMPDGLEELLKSMGAGAPH
jgi:hypothetical protein